MDDTPKIKKILKILEPITFPTAISLSPFFAAIIDVTNSGNDVPNATIVNPIIASLRPKNLAISFAPSTDKSPPQTIPAKPGAVVDALCGFPSVDYAAHTIMHHLNDYGGQRYEVGYASAIAVILFIIMYGSNVVIKKALAKVGE